MSEYWKSTPKYWCKFCSTHVKDTKFERQQHDATGRHQGNIQRSLKGLHREQETEQRNKLRAQAEVARLNGLVPSTSSPSVATGSDGTPTFQKRSEPKATVDDRKRQWEQLAAMGVALPAAARGDLAIAGDWKTVSEEVVGEVNGDGEFTALALNKGVRKRKVDEDEEEREAAGELIMKKKGWGHTYKTFPGRKGGADDVDSLFATKTLQPKTESDIKGDHQGERSVKAETLDESEVRTRLHDTPTVEEAEQDAPAAHAVVFKKRRKVK